MRVCLLLLLLTLTACKTTSTRRIDDELEKSGDSAEVAASSTVPTSSGADRGPDLRTRGIGPDELGFPPRDDAVVGTIGDESLYKSQIFDYLLETYPQEVRASVAVMLGNRILAAEVEKHGIRVPPSELAAWMTEHRAALRQRAEADLGPGVPFERWLRLSFGQTVAEYETAARKRERSRRLLARVIRYHGILEDTVELRLISVPDRAQADALRLQLDQGADFAVLAERYSIHATAERGGRMIPLWRPALNPALTTPAFSLPIGEVSSVIPVRDRGNRQRYQIIRVLQRSNGRDVPYAEVRAEIDEGLLTKPLAEEEWYMWQVKTERMARMTLPGL